MSVMLRGQRLPPFLNDFMTLEKARSLVLRNQSLIGREYFGKAIDELIILPSDKKLQQVFLKIYADSFDAEETLQSFLGYDVIVRCVLDKKRIDLTNTVYSITLKTAKNYFETS